MTKLGSIHESEWNLESLKGNTVVMDKTNLLVKQKERQVNHRDISAFPKIQPFLTITFVL